MEGKSRNFVHFTSSDEIKKEFGKTIVEFRFRLDEHFLR